MPNAATSDLKENGQQEEMLSLIGISLVQAHKEQAVKIKHCMHNIEQNMNAKYEDDADLPSSLMRVIIAFQTPLSISYVSKRGAASGLRSPC